jgi:hypothetical protein
VERPDLAGVDALFQRCRDQVPGLFDRSSEFVSWRMLRAPDLPYQWLEARQGSELRGLAAIRLPHTVELPVGTLADVIAPPDDPGAIDALIGEAVTALAPKTEAIIAGASHPTDVELLKRHGFHVVRTHYPTVVTTDPALRALVGRLEWRMSKIDHDWDQIHPAAH